MEDEECNSSLIIKRTDRDSPNETSPEALIASLPANIDYLSGYESIGLQVLNRNRIFSVYSAEKDAAVLVIPTAEIPTAIERFPDTEMQAFGEFFSLFLPPEEKDLRGY